jgi:hypothetical protein
MADQETKAERAKTTNDQRLTSSHAEPGVSAAAAKTEHIISADPVVHSSAPPAVRSKQRARTRILP